MHKWSIFIILHTLQEFFKFLHNEMGQYVDKNNISFSQKMLVWGKWTFLEPKMAQPHSSRLALRAF